mmetsp:Transcript_38357/g.90520  ORF Transcript_38357/g.90520 Transcript_38357/m.90520 type:complete len:230 (+) Transcript_38357:1498-2187(+)
MCKRCFSTRSSSSSVSVKSVCTLRQASISTRLIRASATACFSTECSIFCLRCSISRSSSSRFFSSFRRASSQNRNGRSWDARRSLLSARICSLRCFCFSSAFWYKSRCSDSFGGIRGLFLMNSIRSFSARSSISASKRRCRSEVFLTRESKLKGCTTVLLSLRCFLLIIRELRPPRKGSDVRSRWTPGSELYPPNPSSLSPSLCGIRAAAAAPESRAGRRGGRPAGVLT